MNQQVSPNGNAFIRQNEGLKLVIYPDSDDKDTIGWGHLIKLPTNQFIIDQNNTITLDQAEELYREDIFEVEVYLNNVIFLFWQPVPTQYEFDALADFVFQYGNDLSNRFPNSYQVFRTGNRSKIITLLNTQFNNASISKQDNSLVGRRQREILLFRDGVYS